jgi:pimeloyl-ACP methyl ester carboxylesterase
METRRTLALANGTAIHYRLWRAAAPSPGLIVLLHGLASNLTRWSEFIEHTALKERWDILLLDLRGHGESFTRERIGMKLWREDLAALLDREGRERALFVGHSLGANVALWFAAARPERVTGLVLIDPVLPGAARGAARWLGRLSLPARLVIAAIRLLNLMGLRRRRIPNRDLRRLDEEMRTRLLAAGKKEEFVRRYTSPLADLKYFPTANYLQEFLELLRPLPPLAGLGVPVLALLSKGITFTDIEATRAELARLPQVTVELVDAYHWPLTEKPAEVRLAVEKWCERFPG